MNLVSEALPERQPIVIPYQTLRMIDAMIDADQGASFRAMLQKVLPHIGDIYRQDDDGFRTHLGASVLGQECTRATWFMFRWAMTSMFEARMLRLLNRGHMEEGRLIALLLMCGFDFWQQDNNGDQFRISAAGGHIGGSGDGVVQGLPDLAPGTPVLAEFKTHKSDSFEKLAGKVDLWRSHVADPANNMFMGKGVELAKPQHYIQMQIYMKRMGLGACLYCASNKDTDDLYMELVPLKPEVDEEYIKLGTKLTLQKFPPPKLNSSPGYWKCRMCDLKPVCQLGQPMLKNCRTCVHSLPLEDGTWNCTLRSLILNKEAQLKGCELHRPIDQ
jgi:hypothetical protein